MGTYYHLLTRQALPSLPGRVISIDCHPWIVPVPNLPGRYCHSLRVGCVVITDYCRGQVARRAVDHFATRERAARLILGAVRQRGITWLVAHNLSYDLTLAGVWEWVENGAVALDSYVIDDPPTCLHLQVNGRRLVCVDLLNYWRKPLPSVCQALGRPVPESDPLTDDGDTARDAAECHARATAEAVDSLVAFLCRHLGGGWKPTAAGVSWSAYRSRVWGDRIRVHAHPEATALERESYTGARVSCHRLGHIMEDVYVCDVNNLYGHAMRENPFPTRLLYHRLLTTGGAVAALRQGHGIIAPVRLERESTPDPDPDGGDAVHDGVDRRAVLAGPEVERAINEGRARVVGECAVYELGNPFSSYVDHWYAARRDAQEGNDPAGAALAKLITSTLFGRLAQKGRRWENRDDVFAPERYCVWHTKKVDAPGYDTWRSVAGQAQRQLERGEWVHSAVAVSSFVTSYARVRMDQLRRIAGPENVLYEDTDCLHCTRAGYSRLDSAGEIHPTRLGAMKLVCVSPYAIYWGPKGYEIQGQRVLSGLRADARQVADGLWLQEHKLGLAQLPQAGPSVTVTTQTVPYRR